MVGKKFFSLLALLSAALIWTLFLSGDNRDPYCNTEHRYFSDADFVRAALRSEIERRRLPGGFEIGSVDAFLAENGDCCRVERGNHRFAYTSFLDRLLLEDSVLVTVVLRNENSEYDTSIDYIMRGCGDISDRFVGRLPKLS